MLPSQNGTSTTSHLLPVTFSPWIPTASVHLNTYLEYLPTQLTYLPTYLAYLDLERMNNVNYTSMLCTSGLGQWEQSWPPISTWQSNRLRWKVEILRTSIGSMAWRALGRTPLFFTSQARVRPHLNTPWHVHSCHYLKTHVSKWHVKSNVKWLSHPALEYPSCRWLHWPWLASHEQRLPPYPPRQTGRSPAHQPLNSPFPSHSQCQDSMDLTELLFATNDAPAQHWIHFTSDL